MEAPARRIPRALSRLARLSMEELVEPFADALFPARCRLCGGAAADDLACPAHALDGRPPPPRCDRCAGPLPDALPDLARCAACRRSAPPFREVAALADYRSEAARAWVLALKHGGRRDLAEPLGVRLADRLREVGSAPGAPPDAPARPGSGDGANAPELPGGPPPSGRAVLVPVPLHRWRRLERGYDQALLLARAAAAELGLPVVRALARTRRTPPQGTAGASSRSANVRGAFAPVDRARPALEGADAWVVDDVVTSGATAAECARCLRHSGARRVGVLAVARAAGTDALPSPA